MSRVVERCLWLAVCAAVCVSGVVEAQQPKKASRNPFDEIKDHEVWARMDTKRFEIHQSQTYRRDQFLLDTQTGRVWVFVGNENNMVSGLQELSMQSLKP